MDSSTEIVEMLSPHALAQRVAEQAMQMIAAAEGVLIGFSDGHGVTFTSGAGFLLHNVATNVDMHASLSGLAIRTKKVLYSKDTTTDPRVDLDACRRLHVASSVCVPLCRGDEILGIMAVSSTRTGAFDDDDIALLTRMADFMSIAVGLATDLARVGQHLVRGHSGDARRDVAAGGGPNDDQGPANKFLVSVLRPDAVSQMEARERIQSVLEHPELLAMTFQPILDTDSGSTAGVEALARFYDGSSDPSMFFAEAHSAQLGIELELLAIEKALACLPRLPDAWFLTVNVGPETIVSRQFAETLGGVDARRVVMELTEHRRVADYAGLMRTLQTLRATGARLAIDDTGAGFSSLSHILKLATDFIKLDRDLVAGIDLDPVRRLLAASLVHFAAGTGSEIIAEGVETQDELETLESLGVHLSQGYHHGRPAYIESLFGSSPQRSSGTRRGGSSIHAGVRR